MNLQLVEDKYSALRALVQEATVSTEPDASASYNNQATDEFGEFVSAEQPATNTPAIDALNTENFAEMFTDIDFKSNSSNTNPTDFNLAPEVSESFDNLKLEDTVEERSLEMGKRCYATPILCFCYTADSVVTMTFQFKGKLFRRKMPYQLIV